MLTIEGAKEEVRKLIDYLRENNLSEAEIMELIKPTKKLSRLVFTGNYRIILPDYDYAEVRLEPIQKAIYLLFLRHAEGIRFKELPDYREELAEIYQDVTDPLNHSIIEKCARIKQVFKQITPHEEYVITGEKGEVKRITLDRELVEWQ